MLGAITPTLPVLHRSKIAGIARLAPRWIDLCLFAPRGMLDRSYRPFLDELAVRIEKEGPVLATLVVEILGLRSGYGKGPRILAVRDETGEMELVFFHGRVPALRRRFPTGSRLAISGRADLYRGRLRMAHPDRVTRAEQIEAISGVEPIYTVPAGLTQHSMAGIIGVALHRIPDLPEWIEPDLLAREGWPSFAKGLEALHRDPGTWALRERAPAWRRLAYDELLAMHLAQASLRERIATLPAPVITPAVVPARSMRARILAGLAFRLTGAQERALGEISDDLRRDRPMMRLVQGDVGSGKTLVAACAMVDVVEAGWQAAMLAPTEMLALQHFSTLSAVLGPAELRMELLIGRMSAPDRRRVLAGLQDGSVDLVIGTHALFQKTVHFRKLGLAVIDEQHRFGVMQRMALLHKSSSDEDVLKSAHLLSMTATPIPRSLLMTLYGDVDVSVIDEKPVGRPEIITRVLPVERVEEVVAALGRSFADGNKAYWICPQIHENEASDLAAAESRFSMLAERFPGRVGLAHGGVKAIERDLLIGELAKRGGGIDLLVATTVVEVGIDVKSATVIVIENAERFGLAQLHQLRGRVGRGERASACILLYGGDMTEAGRARLQMIRDCRDGFRLAEADLTMRGGGDSAGSRQSGLPQLRLADLAMHGDLAELARRFARSVVRAGDLDPGLRLLLHIFDRADVLDWLGD